MRLIYRISDLDAKFGSPEALRGHLKQSGESLNMQNKCAEIKIRAERRGGELLAGMELKTENPQ